MQPSQEHISNQNIDYYNTISADYDRILRDDTETNLARKKVADKLISLVNEGTVLDFGGGTGEDLQWLIEHNFTVLFCEPSIGMRKIAKGKFSNENIIFIEDPNTDFTIWNQSLPFQQKANALLANFAVLNCILDIDLFFKNVALITTPNAEILLLVLDYNLIKRIQMGISKKPCKVKVEYESKEQLVYLHTLNSIKKATNDLYEFKSFERMKEKGFLLIHLTRI
jgi:SAM-dependent methyltransferase